MSTRAKWPEIREIKSGARRGWELEALCGDADPRSFEADEFESGIPDRARYAAQDFCAWCPVRRDCDLAADAYKTPGMRAGYWRTIEDAPVRYHKAPLLGPGARSRKAS